MRVSWSEEDFEANFASAQMESVKGFSDDTMYLERYVERPRHIEFQIMADKYGNVVHLGERDCSIQRRHQKVLEESPSVAISEELRRKMGETAVRAAKAVGYENGEEHPSSGETSGDRVGQRSVSDQRTDSGGGGRVVECVSGGYPD